MAGVTNPHAVRARQVTWVKVVGGTPNPTHPSKRAATTWPHRVSASGNAGQWLDQSVFQDSLGIHIFLYKISIFLNVGK